MYMAGSLNLEEVSLIPEQGTYYEGESSNIDDITLHELYLWPFADAIRAGTGSIMCSYNQINNSYASVPQIFLTTSLSDK